MASFLTYEVGMTLLSLIVDTLNFVLQYIFQKYAIFLTVFFFFKI